LGHSLRSLGVFRQELSLQFLIDGGGTKGKGWNLGGEVAQGKLFCVNAYVCERNDGEIPHVQRRSPKHLGIVTGTYD